MVNLYALEAQMKQHTDDIRCELEQAQAVIEARRRTASAGQMARPDAAQYGARIWRLRSLPAWSRGRSETKSTDRGRL